MQWADVEQRRARARTEPTSGELELRPGDTAWVQLPAGVLTGTVLRVSKTAATVSITPTIEVRALFGRGHIGRA